MASARLHKVRNHLQVNAQYVSSGTDLSLIPDTCHIVFVSVPLQGDKDADKPPPMEMQYGTKPKLHKLSKKEVCSTFLLAGWFNC